MVQVQYCCLSCYSSHYLLTCLTYPRKIASNANFIDTTNTSSSSSNWSIPSVVLLIMDLFLKCYYLLYRKIRSLQTCLCYLLQYQGIIIAFSRMNYYHNRTIRYDKKKKKKETPFHIQGMYSNEIVKVKYHHQKQPPKRDNNYTINRIPGSYTTTSTSSVRRSRNISTFFLVLFVFFHLLSTTQSSITGKRQQLLTFILCFSTTSSTTIIINISLHKSMQGLLVLIIVIFTLYHRAISIYIGVDTFLSY